MTTDMLTALTILAWIMIAWGTVVALGGAYVIARDVWSQWRVWRAERRRKRNADLFQPHKLKL